MTSGYDSHETWLQRALQLLELGRLPDARNAVLEALAIDPESAMGYRILAKIEIELHHFTAAREAAERLLTIDSENYYGLVYLAIASFCDASFQPPNRVPWYQLQTTPPRFDYAKSLLKNAIARDPDCPDAWTSLARIQFAMEYRKQALMSVDQALTIGGPDPRRLLLKSKILRSLRKHSEADEALRLSLSLSPEDSKAHLEAAQTAFARNDLTAAAQHANEAVRLDPNNAEHREQFFRSLQIQSPVTRFLLSFELQLLSMQNWRWLKKLSWFISVPITGIVLLHSLGFRDERTVVVPPLLVAGFPFIPVGPAECARLIQILHQKTVIEHRRIVLFDLACRAALPFFIVSVAIVFLYTQHVGVIVTAFCSTMVVAGLLDFLNARMKD